MPTRRVLALALAGYVVAAATARAQSRGPGEVAIAERDRDSVRRYYRAQVAAGNCPPGLVKKQNGCQPPGQAQKVWTLGKPLPHGVAWSPLPATLLGKLSAPPYGYEYARVGSDVLMIASASRIVAGQLADLGKL